ncbi:hypothetical protein ASPZODRAFT_32466, partial [Penicilliopsis zonata CBS 506.65]
VFLIILALLLAVDATPTVNYPVNAQLPPVARVSEQFEFVFSDSTFTNKGSGTKYSISNAPSWLHLNESSRLFYGTPQSKDVGPAAFTLVASDQSGSSDMDVTFVVMKEKGPGLGESLLPSLANSGSTEPPSSILLYPGNSFNFAFDRDIFTNTDSNTIYYATSSDNSPLPSWIGFNAATLRFSGNTPSSPSSGPQTYTFHVIASDAAGFSAATASFDIVVGTHVLAFRNSTETVQLTRGQNYTSPSFRETLTLDGKSPAGDNLTTIKADSPSWLAFNTASMSLSGVPPTDAQDQNVTISVTDAYQDVAKLMVFLRFSKSLLEGVEDCNVTIGQNFTCALSNPGLSNGSVQLDVKVSPDAASWLKYNPQNKSLSGHVPADLNSQTVSVNLTASEGSATETREFPVYVQKSKDSQGDAASSTGSGSSGIQKKKAGVIAISVIIPFAALSSLIILFCCWRRKRKASRGLEGGEGLSKEKLQISRPQLQELMHCQPFEQTVARERPRTSGSPTQAPDPPPRLELSPLWTTDSLEPKAQMQDSANVSTQSSQPRISWGFIPMSSTDVREDKENENPASPSKESKRLSQTSPLVRRRTTNYSRKREPLKSIQPRSLKRDSVASSRSKRNSRRSSGIQSVSSGLPVRLSGAGHGAGGFGPPGHGVVRVSWQNTQYSLRSDDSSLGNLAPLFPRPPPAARMRNSMSSVPDASKRVSLRAVQPSHSIISESGSLEAFVHSRAKHRNSTNPLFSANMSRRSSSGMRAIEKARSGRSRTNTLASISTETDENSSSSGGGGHYRSERPYSASLYTQDHRQSTYMRPISQFSHMLPRIPASKEQSQSSLAQGYSEMVAPLPQFWSEASLGSGRFE